MDLTQQITHDDMRADAERAVNGEHASLFMLGQHVLALLVQVERLQANPLNALDLTDYARDIIGIFGGASDTESAELSAYLVKYIAPLCRAAQGEYDELRAEVSSLRGQLGQQRAERDRLREALCEAIRFVHPSTQDMVREFSGTADDSCYQRCENIREHRERLQDLLAVTEPKTEGE